MQSHEFRAEVRCEIHPFSIIAVAQIADRDSDRGIEQGAQRARGDVEFEGAGFVDRQILSQQQAPIIGREIHCAPGTCVGLDQHGSISVCVLQVNVPVPAVALGGGVDETVGSIGPDHIAIA